MQCPLVQFDNQGDIMKRLFSFFATLLFAATAASSQAPAPSYATVKEAEAMVKKAVAFYTGTARKSR
jgi:hypothetical protein